MNYVPGSDLFAGGSAPATVRGRWTRSPDRADSFVTVLDLIRFGSCRTRPQLTSISGFGRNIVTHRIAELMSHGLVVEGDFGASTGGRAPRQLTFCANAGHVLVALIGASSIEVGFADLTGQIRVRRSESADVAAGPDVLLTRIKRLFDYVIDELAVKPWGIGIGIPGPVEFTTGWPIAPPIMPGWDNFDIRGFFVAAYGIPVWIDNDANVMALGEFRQGAGRGAENILYVKVGTGVGAGLISGGRIHRGA